MWSWFVSIVQAYLAWAGSWWVEASSNRTLSATFAGHPWALLVLVFCGIAGAIALFRVFSEGESSFWARTGFGAAGLCCGFALGFLVGALVLSLMPLVIALGAATLIALLASASISYGPRVIGVTKPRVSRVRPAVGRLYQVLRQKFALRRRPTDYLAELDASAQEVDRRLRDLDAQWRATGERAKTYAGRIEELRGLLQKLPADSASAQIAADLREKFRDKYCGAQEQETNLATIIIKIRQGQREMDGLISLARMCRQAGEADIATDTRALEAARKALDALRRAFEQADAVLSAAVVEADLGLELAFQQSDEAYHRSVQLSDAVDGVTLPGPPRVRV